MSTPTPKIWMGTQVNPCSKCGVAPTCVDECGEFGNPECPYFGIGREEYERRLQKPVEFKGVSLHAFYNGKVLPAALSVSASGEPIWDVEYEGANLTCPPDTIPDSAPRYYVGSMGKVFLVTHVASTPEEANEFCEQNPDSAVIVDHWFDDDTCVVLIAREKPAAEIRLEIAGIIPH